MKQSYTQLTEPERYPLLYAMRKQNTPFREIAKGMGRSHTTLSREETRNTDQKGYRYQQAHQKAGQRHKDKPKAVKLTESVMAYMHEKLSSLVEPRANMWTLEARAGRLGKPRNDLSLGTERPAARRATLSALAPPSQAVPQTLWPQGISGTHPGPSRYCRAADCRGHPSTDRRLGSRFSDRPRP